MQASDMMTSTVITVRPEATVGEAARRMLGYNISALPVVDEQGGLVGILTHSDFGLRTRYRPWPRTSITCWVPRPRLRVWKTPPTG